MCDHRNPERCPMFQMGARGKMNEITYIWCLKISAVENDSKRLQDFPVSTRFIFNAYTLIYECKVMHITAHYVIHKC
jgi:hypothetical protein